LIVLDTEQTGMRDNQVCQLAYVKIALSGELTVGNKYFAVDEMNEHAFAVHGLSVSSLLRLSGGKRFKDSAREIANALRGARIAGHGIASDLRVLRSELFHANVAFFPEAQFCTMHHFAPIMRMRVPGQRRSKDPNLAELCHYLGVTSEIVSKLHNRLFGGDGAWHDARFDVCATLLCIEKATSAGMVRGLLPEGWCA
jgi:DNA polymerase III epsilon subunit-like protein